MPTRVFIRHPTHADEQEFLTAAALSRALHRPWTHVPRFASEYQSWLRRMDLPTNKAFLVCRSDNNAIVGVINLTNIMLGLFRSAYLGYYVFAGHERRGLMREGMQLVLRHAFKVLKLRRVEANIQPDNVASLALIRSCRFAKEGFSPRYLKIGGRWKDHERWALVAG